MAIYIMFTDNEYEFYQDYSWWKGIPSHVLFEVVKCDESEGGTLWLAAPGYGGKPYGNGAIAVRLQDVFEASIGAKNLQQKGDK